MLRILHMLASLSCLYLSIAIPLTENNDTEIEISHSRDIKVYIIVRTFVINTTDVVHEDEITTEISGEPSVLKNVTTTGWKNCTGDDADYGDRELLFNFNCPHIVVKYKSESCKERVDDKGVGTCEFDYHNLTAKVNAKIVEHEAGFEASRVSIKNATFDFKDEFPPPRLTPLPIERRFRDSILLTFFKKSDLFITLFY